MLFVPSIFAFLLGGLYMGLVWAAGSYMIIAAMITAHYFGHDFPFLIAPDYIIVNELIKIHVGLFSVFSMVVLYEFYNAWLRRTLDHDEKAYQWHAQRDPLTGLGNRRHFNRALKTAISEYQKTGQSFQLYLIDLNNFKAVNDRYGHAVGDQLLQRFSQQLTKSLPQSYQAFRIGGDEFALIRDLGNKAERPEDNRSGIVNSIARAITINGNTFRLTASIGVAYFPLDGDDFESIQIAADADMYLAKPGVSHETADTIRRPAGATTLTVNRDRAHSSRPQNKAYAALSTLLNFFIPQTFKADTELYHRAQLFVFVAFTLSGMLLAYELIQSALDIIHPSLNALPTSIDIALITGFIMSCFLLRWNVPFWICGNIPIVMIFADTIFINFITSGPISSISTFLLLCAPLFAFVTLGLRMGALWMITAYIALMADIYAIQLGYEFPQMIPDAYLRHATTVNVHLGFISVILVMSVYESSNSRLITKLEKRRDYHRYTAEHDTLTGLANRQAFISSAKNRLDQKRASNAAAAVMLIDLNNFKPINDRFGHANGDRVLPEIAQRKRSLGDHGIVARLGGDEFGVLLDNSYAELDKASQKLIVDALFDKPVSIHGEDIHSSASTGIARFPDDGDTLSDLLECADHRMYAEKTQRSA